MVLISVSAWEEPPYKATPLERISAILNKANLYLGYPYKVEAGIIVPRRVKPWAILIMFVAFFLGGPTLFMVELQQRLQEEPWEVVKEKSGQSDLDLFTAWTSSAVAFATSIFIIWTSRKKSALLNEVFGKLRDVGLATIGFESRIKIDRLITRLKYALFAFLFFFFTACYWLYYIVFFKDLGYGHWGIWVTFVNNLIAPIYYCMNPLLFTNSFLHIFLYSCMSECYEKLNIMIRTLPRTDKNTQRIIKCAHELEQLLQEITVTCGDEILIACGAYLLYLSMHTYSFMCALLDLNKLYRVLMGIVSAIADTMFISAFYTLYNTGQQVEDARAKAAVTLEDFIMHGNIKTADVKTVLERLLKRLEHPKPVSPCSAFPLNHSGLMSAITASVTYLIVLMQFKVTECIIILI